MMRSLYSGISGLTNHQTRMDVIANNIANVNTVGFKRSRTVFQDVYSQTARQGATGTEQLGGINKSQIGLGVKLSSIDVIHTSAAIARSDWGLDVMIDGDGFFTLNSKIVGNPRLEDGFDPDVDTVDDFSGYAAADDGKPYYTRAGDLRLDNNGMLVSSHGFFVMGYLTDVQLDDTTGKLISAELPDPLNPDELYAIDTSGYDSVAIDEYGYVWGRTKAGEKVPFAVLAISTFPNNAGLEKVGNSLFSSGGPSGDVKHNMVGDPACGIINTGGTEMSNVDLATEFTDMIVTQRGFQANSRIITVSDTMLEELVNLKR